MSPSGPACQSGMDADDGIEVGVSRAHYCCRGDRGPSGGRMHRFYTGPLAPPISKSASESLWGFFE